MNKIDFASINAALDGETVVPQWLPQGYRRGAEWVAKNPNRADGSPGSFTINMRKGVWKDYATGDAGADLVSLYAYLFCDDDQGAAAHELAKNRGIKLGDNTPRDEAPNVKRIDDAQPKLVVPVPVNAPECTSFKHPTHGEASQVWSYFNEHGQLMLYVCRFDPPGERKQICPRSWCDHPGKGARWTWRGITGKSMRPLYGLDRLAAMPDADVIMVEGEKAADAGQAMMADQNAVVSWMGGVETADRVDLSPLAGRRVILFPDHDAQRLKLSKEEQAAGVDPGSKPLLPINEQPGVRAMLTIARALKGVAREVVMVGYKLDTENAGWDLADAQEKGWDGNQVKKYIAANANDPAYVASGKFQRGDAANDNTPNPFLPLDYDIAVEGYPHLSDKNQPLNTVENLAHMIGQYGITVRYNITRKYVEVKIPGRDYGDDLDANCTLAEINSLCARNRMPMSSAPDYIKLISSKYRYNPVEEFIKSQPWDGKSRFGELGDTLTTAPGFDRDLMALLLRRWLISAAAAALKPRGFWSKGVLVLQGAQSEGKTSWIKALLPPDLRHLLKVGATIDPANKDSVSSVISHWLVELGELDGTFRKADIARLKGFISQDIDQLRRPYDRLESEYQRRTVFFASVNPKVFLVDDTGNVRWWTIPILALDVEHGIDVQQLWAEAAHYYEQGERWWLTKEEEARLEATNADHQEPNTIEERILTAFDWDKPGTTQMTSTQVLQAIGVREPANKQAKDAGVILRKLTKAEPKRSNGKTLFMMPPQVQSRFNHSPYPSNDAEGPW